MPHRSSVVALVPTTGGRALTGPTLLAGLTLLACAVTRVSGLDHAGISFCYFKALTGYACFTCGTTRALGHLSRLDLPSAFAVQPLVTAGVLGLILWGTVDGVLMLASRRTLVQVRGGLLKWFVVAGGALAILNWAYLLAAGV
jgi:hypothetical protein